MLAASEIYQVNIVVFIEKKDFFMPNGFNYSYGRSLFLAYRLGGFDEDGVPSYEHYDSICEINESILYKCALKFVNFSYIGEVDLTTK